MSGDHTHTWDSKSPNRAHRQSLDHSIELRELSIRDLAPEMADAIVELDDCFRDPESRIGAQESLFVLARQVREIRGTDQENEV